MSKAEDLLFSVYTAEACKFFIEVLSDDKYKTKEDCVKFFEALAARYQHKALQEEVKIIINE
jgi:hypothetical protein